MHLMILLGLFITKDQCRHKPQESDIFITTTTTTTKIPFKIKNRNKCSHGIFEYDIMFLLAGIAKSGYSVRSYIASICFLASWCQRNTDRESNSFFNTGCCGLKLVTNSRLSLKAKQMENSLLSQKPSHAHPYYRHIWACLSSHSKLTIWHFTGILTSFCTM